MGTATEHDASRIRVAIIDDSDDVRFLLATILQVDGRFEIVGEAHSADAGLDLVTEVDPDLVLIDLQLGDHDGTWLIRALRSRGGHARLAVVTGSSHQPELDAAYEAGADSVHNKMSMTSTMVDDLVTLVGDRTAARCA